MSCNPHDDVSQRHKLPIHDDALDVSCIAAGKIRLRREVLEFQTAMARVVESCRNQIESRRHELTMSFPEKPVYLLADPARLEQILVNLLNNAAKYTPPQGRISVEGSVDQKTLVLRFWDNGLGITRESLPHVFDLFMQADRSLASSPKEAWASASPWSRISSRCTADRSRPSARG